MGKVFLQIFVVDALSTFIKNTHRLALELGFQFIEHSWHQEFLLLLRFEGSFSLAHFERKVNNRALLHLHVLVYVLVLPDSSLDRIFLIHFLTPSRHGVFLIKIRDRVEVALSRNLVAVFFLVSSPRRVRPDHLGRRLGN